MLDSFASSTLTNETPERNFVFHVAEPQILHFLTRTGSVDTQDRQALSVTVKNSAGDTDLNLTVLPSQTRSAPGVLLSPGTYVANVQMLALDARPEDLQAIEFELLGAFVSSPFSITPVDPIGEEEFCYPNDVVTTDPFLWDTIGKTPSKGTIGTETPRNSIIRRWRGFPPQTTNDSYETTGGELRVDATKGVLSNDPDAKGDSVKAILTRPPQHGSVTLDPDGGFLYCPTVGFTGTDTFEYRAKEGIRQSVSTAVNISVLNPSVPGDSNLDGVFNDLDIVLIFQAGEYLDNLKGNSTWATGDWNGDGEFDNADLGYAFQTPASSC